MAGAQSEDETTVRQRRVAELITEEMTLILQDEVDNPRIAGTQVTGARVSRDLRVATIFVAPLESENSRELIAALDRSGPFLRRQLAARAFLRFVPELRFRIDDSIERSKRIESLLDEVVPKDATPDEPDPAGE
ncbi:MAG: 30S ribosome-binding factor RbfA [Anaerolineae bacterium]